MGYFLRVISPKKLTVIQKRNFSAPLNSLSVANNILGEVVSRYFFQKVQVQKLLWKFSKRKFSSYRADFVLFHLTRVGRFVPLKFYNSFFFQILDFTGKM